MSSDPFVLFWHRYGNTRAGVELVHAAAREAQTLGGRPVAQGMELDLKWTGPDEEPILYAHHGPTGRERLRPKAVERRTLDGSVVCLSELLGHPEAAELHYLVEVKRGHGSPRAALRAFNVLVEAHGLVDQVWLAASSYDMLGIARVEAPKLKRVLFGSTLGSDRVLHKPTTYTLRSLRRHGISIRPTDDTIELLCPLGLWPVSVESHGEKAAAARDRGLGYLPGRVTTEEAMADLASKGYPGAFVYGRLGRG